MPLLSSEWCKSSYSGQNGECVEARSVARGLDVRDSTAFAEPMLTFSAPAWTTFLVGVKAGVLEAGPRPPRRC
ncbi:DUF397 domain-containing protein [Streptomyces longispororuber]|uniref:DUF397 domain-containing protein n=1 Tax=Streptomyces longispororuber TaxID=68230 RepID=UPI0036F5F1F3